MHAINFAAGASSQAKTGATSAQETQEAWSTTINSMATVAAKVTITITQLLMTANSATVDAVSAMDLLTLTAWHVRLEWFSILQLTVLPTVMIHLLRAMVSTVILKLPKRLQEQEPLTCVSSVIPIALLAMEHKMESVQVVKMAFSCRSVPVLITAPTSNIRTWSWRHALHVTLTV